MSGADFFDDSQAINPLMDSSIAVDRTIATDEHNHIKAALQQGGVKVIQVKPPKDCQDGVYTANWALVHKNKAIMARLPNARKGEEAYAEQVLRDLGKEIYHVPDGLKFSGQGDALRCGTYLFCGSGYRSDPAAQKFAAETLGLERIQLRAIPTRTWYGKPLINKASGWADSYFYDIDLALSILREPTKTEKGLIAYAPHAFTKESQKLLEEFDGVEKITVDFNEAKHGFACNLVSTGNTIVMTARAPKFTAELKARGFTVITPEINELAKGGGYIRCTTLTLD